MEVERFAGSPQGIIAELALDPGVWGNKGSPVNGDIYVRTGRIISPWTELGFRKLVRYHDEHFGTPRLSQMDFVKEGW